jgi:hypothetical protein
MHRDGARFETIFKKSFDVAIRFHPSGRPWYVSRTSTPWSARSTAGRQPG